MTFDYAATRKALLAMGACDRCIGRQFRGLFRGRDNAELGAAVRLSPAEAGAAKKSSAEPLLSESCPLCAGAFLRVPAIAEQALERIENLDHSTFLVGCRVDPSLQSKEEELWAEIGTDNCEPLKKDLVRQIGLAIAAKTGKEVDFVRPDINITADFETGKVAIDIRPLFVYGEYKKLARGIPQTRWPCRDCRGRGCRRCGGTGKMYSESVEELIAAKLMEETGAKAEAFHGSGREDIDATMLGWRPFVLELQQPVVRFLDWDAMTRAVNASAGGKVEVQGLRKSSKEEVITLKEAKHDKSYEAIVECEAEYSDAQMRTVEKLLNGAVLQQRTPDRVSHRRADLVRERTVYSVELSRLDGKKLRAVIKAASGTYIKELISGDEGRTTPSFAEVLGPCKCVELNVLEVHEIV